MRWLLPKFLTFHFLHRLYWYKVSCCAQFRCFCNWHSDLWPRRHESRQPLQPCNRWIHRSPYHMMVSTSLVSSCKHQGQLNLYSLMCIWMATSFLTMSTPPKFTEQLHLFWSYQWVRLLLCAQIPTSMDTQMNWCRTLLVTWYFLISTGQMNSWVNKASLQKQNALHFITSFCSNLAYI